ncbi:BnaA08g12220D [Brassica napus]|uniref:S-protein homolog n=1 Tax=Brassica napus TaxID=3708 RepID=A0A078GD74_BRANA|nr:BnaA08g12220D [Brassica napus]
MSPLSCFLIVIALSAELSNGESYDKDSVHFINSLNPNNILRVHCLTHDDDLGYHLLSPGQTYEFSFYESIFTTKVAGLEGLVRLHASGAGECEFRGAVGGVP